MTLAQLSGQAQGHWRSLSLDNLFVPIMDMGIDLRKDGTQGAHAGIERQIVYGKPGVGNSTLCRFLATKWAEQKYWQMKQTQIMGAVTDNDGIGGYRWVFSVDVKALCALPDMATHTGRTTHALATAVYGLCLLPADRQRAEEGLYGHRKTASASPQQLSPQALRNGIIDWIEDEIIVPEEMQQDTLWIIDGLDRAQAYLHQPTVLGRLFKRLLHSTHVLIVTAPLARLPAMPALQRTLVNRGFLDKDIARYVYRYFAATPKVADDLWAVLVRNKGSHIWALCRTPLLLTLVCRLWEQAEDAAHRKHLATQWDSGVTAFYSAIVQAFFEAQYHREQMTASNGAITPFLADDHHSLEAGLQGLGHTAQARRQLLFTHYGPILSALGQFAFEGIRHQCGTLSLPLLEEVATAHRVKDMPTWLAQLRASGLFQAQRSVESLRQSIDGLSPHGFTHKALQPYLAAGYIAHVLNNHTQPMIRKQMEDFIIAHRYDAHWRGVWPLVAGITCETIVYMRAREVFWACLHAVPEDITGFGYLRLVTECLEATYIGGEQADAVLSGWRKSWVQLVKDWVPTSLSDVGSSHWEALVPILTPLTHLRRALLTALLVSMEEQAGTDVERQCHYLNQLMTGIVLLQETLLPDQKERLFAYLKSDAAPVRCAVAKGIASLVHQWQTDWKSLSTPLLAALQHETVDSVREALGQVLIAMGAMITGDAIVPIQTQICEAMTSKDSNVRKTVIRVLTQWMDVDKSASCLVPLWAMYHEASDVWIQCDLLKVLSLLGNTPNEREATAAQMIGIATQGQGHQYMRRAALVALSDMVGALDNGGARWINSLLQVINTDTQASLRKKAVDLMKAWVSRYPQESYEETAMALQRAMCKEADKGVQFALTELITVLKTLTMVCDDTPIVDAPIRHRLSRSKESPETPVNIYDLAWDMIGKVGKEESKTRLQGLKILFQHSKNRPERLEATIEALVERQLKEEDPWVRCDLLKTACTLALASTKARLRILPILKCSVLEDASPYVRRAGLRYLVEVARYEQGHEGEAAIIGGIGEIVLSAFTCVSLKSEGLRIKLVETLQVLAIGGLIKEVDAVAVLLAAVKGETSLLLRQHLVMALGTLGGAIEQANEVLVYLLQSLNTENNSLLRDTLLLSLQEIVEKRGGLGVVTTELEPAIVVNKTVTRTDMALLGLALQSPLLATGTVCLNQDNTRAITKTQKDQQLSLWLAAVVKAQHPLLVTDEGLVVHLEQGGVLLPYKKGLTALKKRCISALTTHEVAIQEIQRWHRSLLSTGYGGSSGSPLCQSSLKRNTLTTFGGTVFKRVKSKSKENVLQITTPPALNSMASVECPML
ncbi:MAG: NACHT domain-containing protein [Gammaproteobacteria bacterium]